MGKPEDIPPCPKCQSENVRYHRERDVYRLVCEDCKFSMHNYSNRRLFKFWKNYQGK